MLEATEKRHAEALREQHGSHLREYARFEAASRNAIEAALATQVEAVVSESLERQRIQLEVRRACVRACVHVHGNIRRAAGVHHLLQHQLFLARS